MDKRKTGKQHRLRNPRSTGVKPLITHKHRVRSQLKVDSQRSTTSDVVAVDHGDHVVHVHEHEEEARADVLAVDARIVRERAEADGGERTVELEIPLERCLLEPVESTVQVAHQIAGCRVAGGPPAAPCRWSPSAWR